MVEIDAAHSLHRLWSQLHLSILCERKKGILENHLGYKHFLMLQCTNRQWRDHLWQMFSACRNLERPWQYRFFLNLPGASFTCCTGCNDCWHTTACSKTKKTKTVAASRIWDLILITSANTKTKSVCLYYFFNEELEIFIAVCSICLSRSSLTSQ